MNELRRRQAKSRLMNALAAAAAGLIILPLLSIFAFLLYLGLRNDLFRTGS